MQVASTVLISFYLASKQGNILYYVQIYCLYRKRWCGYYYASASVKELLGVICGSTAAKAFTFVSLTIYCLKMQESCKNRFVQIGSVYAV